MSPRPRSALLLACLLAPCAAVAAPPISFVEAHFHVQGALDRLQGALGTIVSPDGANAYTLGKGDDAVSEWARDPATGGLTALGRMLGNNNPGGTVPNFDRPVAAAMSADGRFLYVVTSNTDPTQSPPTTSGVAIFSRDPATGLLGYVASVLDGQDGSSLENPASVAISPDGSSVYVGDFARDFEEGAVNTYARDPSTGLLTHVQTLSHVAMAADGLDRVHRLAASPDGKNVYITSHGTLGADQAIATYARDPATGALSFVSILMHGMPGVTGLGDPYGALVSPDGAFVYVASYSRSSPAIAGSIDVFARDPATGVLSAAFSDTEGAIGVISPTSLVLSPDGSRLFMCAQGTIGSYVGKLTAFTRDAATGKLALIQVLTDNANGVDGLKGALDVAISPDGTSLYVSAEQDQPPGSTQTETGALAVFAVAPPPGAGMPACSDGIDNDGDGLVDYPMDPGCSSPTDDSELDATHPCDDGIDNDGDGLVDWRLDGSGDPGCASAAATSIENPACQDGIDNDRDGGIDFDGGASANHGVALGPPDANCATPSQRSELPPAACGLGAELGLALPLVLALRARRRRS